MEHARVGEVFNFGVLHMEWPTALFVFAVFVVTLFFLNQFLFKPLLATLDARELAMTGNDKKLKEIEAEILALEAHFRAELKKTHQTNEAAHTAAVAKATAASQQIITAAMEQSARLMDQSDKDIAEALTAAQTDAKVHASTLAQLIQTKLLAN